MRSSFRQPAGGTRAVSGDGTWARGGPSAKPCARLHAGPDSYGPPGHLCRPGCLPGAQSSAQPRPARQLQPGDESAARRKGKPELCVSTTGAERGGEGRGKGRGAGQAPPHSRHPAPAARKRPRRIPLKGTALLVGGLGGRQEPPEDADIKLDAVFMTNTCDLLLHNRSPQALAGKCGAPFLLCRFFM